MCHSGMACMPYAEGSLLELAALADRYPHHREFPRRSDRSSHKRTMTDHGPYIGVGEHDGSWVPFDCPVFVDIVVPCFYQYKVY